MGDIAQRGNRLTFAKGGKGEWIEPIKTKAKKDTESVRDVRAKGGRAGHALGHTAGRRLTKTLERLGGGEEGKPHSTRTGRIAAGARKIKRIFNRKLPKPADWKPIPQRPKRPPWKPHGGVGGPMVKAEGGRIGFKKGGTDKKWMQKVSASIKKRGTKGKCTPITKKGCTGRALALAKTFKKIAAKRKA